MFNLFKKETEPEFEYNPDIHKAVLKCSICNGEQVAGFKNMNTGEFHEISLIKNESELQMFLKRYKIAEIRKEY